MSKTKIRLRGGNFAVIIIVALYAIWTLGRPLSFTAPIASPHLAKSPSVASELSWPSVGQAAVGITPSGVLASHGEQTAIPIASTAKVLTALSVLRKHPIAKGQTGPTITISQDDVAIYNHYLSVDGSVAPVTAGAKFTEYQMLQAIMLPSANNMADSLAIWAFGSLDAYADFAGTLSQQLGMTHTRVGADASGYDPATVSTAHDLVLLGQAAMGNPVLAEIAAQKSAVIPVAGTITNVNFLLGQDDIVGLKTGNTDQAGGVFLGVSKVTVKGTPLTIVSAVVGSNTLYDALAFSVPLLKSTQNNFDTVTILKAGSVVGSYTLPWGGVATATTAHDLSVLAWKGADIPITVNLQPINTRTSQHDRVGTATITASPYSGSTSTAVQLASTPARPDAWWRLRHPL
ncbi:MAG: peptidase D-alanyl-D-alanine carboxypeptidase 1, D-alanyl-D-alanine carboxypeptidase [Candidatus Saccharibacteria bacterium]|nr:peptidase D-alanyl-D-alanine carboxypeptidase 1, D-alanyl-D-alanine carboxypeptidase [Candidatus Saccharibacteria bacterium]